MIPRRCMLSLSTVSESVRQSIQYSGGARILNSVGRLDGHRFFNGTYIYLLYHKTFVFQYVAFVH